jgi:hypothetical protein
MLDVSKYPYIFSGRRAFALEVLPPNLFTRRASIQKEVPPRHFFSHIDDASHHRIAAINPLRRLASRLDHRASYHQ